MGDSTALNNAHGSPFAQVADVENRAPAPTYWQTPPSPGNRRASARQA